MGFGTKCAERSRRLQVARRLESHPEMDEGCRTMYRIGAPVWLLGFTRFVLAESKHRPLFQNIPDYCH